MENAVKQRAVNSNVNNDLFIVLVFNSVNS
jgi:hypothetical protein